MRILVSGAAGLVGQNLIPLLKAVPGHSILAIDKHAANVKVLRDLHPEIDIVQADMSAPGSWSREAQECDAAVLLHAQIGGLDWEEFQLNNVIATKRALEAAARGKTRYICQISSSVVNSAAVDLYTESKKAQELVALESGLPTGILRPTLMFGWFDRKHLGWLRRFMDRSPVFPIPGNGRYLRQPLYAGDFSAIVASCLKSQAIGSYNISGLETINYVDLIRLIKDVAKARAVIARIPYSMFWALLKTYATFDKSPPFTTQQLEALITPDIFEVIDWPRIFAVKATPLREALDLTFNHPIYSKVELAF